MTSSGRTRRVLARLGNTASLRKRRRKRNIPNRAADATPGISRFEVEGSDGSRSIQERVDDGPSSGAKVSETWTVLVVGLTTAGEIEHLRPNRRTLHDKVTG